MAYARRRAPARRGYSARTNRAPARRRSAGRTSSRRSSRTGGGTTKLVIEVAGLSGVSRPSMVPQVAGALPKRAKY